jgi:hypothetical protein
MWQNSEGQAHDEPVWDDMVQMMGDEAKTMQEFDSAMMDEWGKIWQQEQKV